MCVQVNETHNKKCKTVCGILIFMIKNAIFTDNQIMPHTHTNRQKTWAITNKVTPQLGHQHHMTKT